MKQLQDKKTGKFIKRLVLKRKPTKNKRKSRGSKYA